MIASEEANFASWRVTFSPRFSFTLVTMLLVLGCGAAELNWNVDPQSGRWALGGSSLRLQDAVTSVEVDGAWIAMGDCAVGKSLPVVDALGEGDRTIVTSTPDGL